MVLGAIVNFVTSSGFLPELLATLIGVIVGVPVAFWLQKKIDAKKAEEEKKYLADFLSKNLETNLDLLRQAKPILSSGVLFFNLDLGAWNFISQKLGLLKDDKLAGDISKVYYQLGHLSRKIDLQLEMHYSTFRAIQSYGKDRQALVNSMLPHINWLEKDIQSILARLPGRVPDIEDIAGVSVGVIQNQQHIPESEAIAAQRMTTELHKDWESMWLFILGIVIGVIGNVVATGMWDWCTLGPCAESFILPGKILLFSVSAIGFMIILFVFLYIAKQREIKWKGYDNVSRFYYSAGSFWDAKGNLIDLKNDPRVIRFSFDDKPEKQPEKKTKQQAK